MLDPRRHCQAYVGRQQPAQAAVRPPRKLRTVPVSRSAWPDKSDAARPTASEMPRVCLEASATPAIDCRTLLVPVAALCAFAEISRVAADCWRIMSAIEAAIASMLTIVDATLSTACEPSLDAFCRART